MEPIVVLTNLPDRESALALAQTLVERRLAACVNVLAACTSIYRWRGAVETATEVPVVIKTEDARYPELEAAVRSLHPYEVPELIALPITKGWPEYLTWIASETIENDLG